MTYYNVVWYDSTIIYYLEIKFIVKQNDYYFSNEYSKYICQTNNGSHLLIQNYRVMIENHRKLTNNLRKHLEIERILVSQACNDLIEVNRNI